MARGLARQKLVHKSRWHRLLDELHDCGLGDKVDEILEMMGAIKAPVAPEELLPPGDPRWDLLDHKTWT